MGSKGVIAQYNEKVGLGFVVVKVEMINLIKLADLLNSFHKT